MNQPQITNNLIKAFASLVAVSDLERSYPAIPAPKKVDGQYHIDNAIQTLFNGRICWVIALENGLFLTDDSRCGLTAKIARRNERVAAEVAKQNADIEFRQEVVDAMVEAGIAPHVALNRTKDHAGLMSCAKQYRVI